MANDSPGNPQLVPTLQGIGTNLAKLAQLQRIGNTLPVGAVLGTTIGTVSQQVIGADPNRTGIVFHNAGTSVPLLFAPATDANGAALAPTFSSPQGGFVVLPLDYLPLSGNVQSPWNGAAQSGTTNAASMVTSSF